MRTNIGKLRIGLIALAALSLGASFATAHTGHDDKAEKPIETKRVVDSLEHERARAYFSDTVLVKHDREEVKFYSDMMADRTVVISFIFTECEDACPLINAAMAKLQQRLGERMGEDIFFVSISVDPETDTPNVLADYREKFRAGPGWDFLTGEPEAIEYVGSRLGQVFERESHLTALLVGNTKTARWRKVQASLPVNVLAEQILQIADEEVSLE